MGENAYFQEALAHFTQEAAWGGAVRHLADLGYSVKQIVDSLDFPTPYGKVQAFVWEYLLENDVLLPGRPGGVEKEKSNYVKEYDKYGKVSFRRVVEIQKEEAVRWRERIVKREDGCPAKIDTMLRARQEENGIENSYMSCDFGIYAKMYPERYKAVLQILGEKQREYIAGLPWENRRMYHRLNSPMLDILVCLYTEDAYQGECCFQRTGEVLVLA